MKAFLPLLLALLAVPAQAIDPGYARQLERAGCTQMSELQGCDIRRSRAENERAGFKAGQPVTPYAGRWLARHDDGRPVARIRIDGNERVRVDDQPVQARRSDGALVFRRGPVMFTVQGDRRLVGEDVWRDTDAGTQGPIVAD
jgi:hypothetical protein